MSKRGKPPPHKPPANDTGVLDAETRRSQRRVAKARDKLTKAMEDPEMRAQVVAAMRAMLNEGREK